MSRFHVLAPTAIFAALFGVAAPLSAKTPCNKPVVFQIRDKADLIPGVKADGQVGDYKICNNKVSFIVEGLRNSDGYQPNGGMLVDAQPTQGQQNDTYGEIIPLFNVGGNQIFKFRTFRPTKITPSQRGQTAVLTVEGEDALFPILEGLLRVPTASHGLKITYEYALALGSGDLVATVRVTPSKNTSVVLGMGYMMGDGLERFAPGLGYDLSSINNRNLPYFGATSPGFSVLWAVKGMPYKVIFARGGPYLFGQYGRLPAAPDKPAVYEFHTLVGQGDIETLRHQAQVIATGKPQKEKLVRLTVKLAGPAAPKLKGRQGSVSVHLLGPKGKAGAGEAANESEANKMLFAPLPPGEGSAPPPDLTFISSARTDAKGVAVFNVPAGQYTLMAGEPGLGAYANKKAAVDGKKPVTVTLNRPASGLLAVEVSQKGAGAIPALLLIKPLFVLKDLPGYVGQKTLHRGYSRMVFQGPKPQAMALLPGEYEVSVSRGFDYGLFSQKIKVEAGKEATLKAVLKKQVDTTGWHSGDFHLHAMPSPDSDDALLDKVLALAAYGVDVAVATDHNVITDYAPAVKEAGLSGHLASIIGMELTTFTFGHFNTFPLKIEEEKANNGFDLMDYHNKSVPQLFDFMKKQSGPEVLFQLNHPRAPSVGGFFNASGYSREVGKATNTVNFPPDFNFDVIEAFNGKRVLQLAETLPDLYSFLDRGKRVWATGNSDSHHSDGFEPGYPRNYVFTGLKSVQEITPAFYTAQVRAGKMMVSGGHFISATSGGKGMGELVPAPGGKAELAVKVQAADWVSADDLMVIVGGKPVQTISLAGKKGLVRFDEKIPLTLEKDTYVMIRVDGKEKMPPLYPDATPTSFTNPIFFDVDGNGKFDAPLGGSWP